LVFRFFDADGTITYSFKNDNPQLTISVSNKLEENIKIFKLIFGGNIYLIKVDMVILSGSFKVQKILILS